ncbi:hypothetical protein HQ520_00995, partial [bacterium]|nr:hypothetical protein [bacterium]
YMKPHVVQEIRSPTNEVLHRANPNPVRTVCSPQTSKIVLNMMEEVVQHGTGTEAALPGYRVGGKTGTTRKLGGTAEDSNARRYYASFIGVLPIDSPRLVIYTWIDEPQKARYGGTVAAPVFRTVAEHATRVLGIEPTEPLPEKGLEEQSPRPERVLVQEESDEVGDEVLVDKPEGVLMPDLTGLTVREVAEELNELSIDAEMIGTGVAVQQQPLPNMPLDGNTRSLVIFGRPSEGS